MLINLKKAKLYLCILCAVWKLTTAALATEKSLGSSCGFQTWASGQCSRWLLRAASEVFQYTLHLGTVGLPCIL